MSRKLGGGDQVNVQCYNTPEGKFYGPVHTGTILEINPGRGEYCYLIQLPLYTIWIQRKEIKRRVKVAGERNNGS